MTKRQSGDEECAGARLAERFAEHFRPWGLLIPPGDAAERRRGKIVAGGWAVWYLFGRDERGEYLDYYASHRMTNDRHVRLRPDGADDALPALPDVRIGSPDPATDARLRAEHDAECRATAAMLRAKGFFLEGDEPGGVQISMLLRSGDAGIGAP